MADTRPAPPPLASRCPDCSICGEETRAEDGSYLCEHCDCSWDVNGIDYEHGEWNDPDATQCATTVQPYVDNTWIKDDDERKRLSYRCVRDADHIESDCQEVKEHAHPEMAVCEKGWV